MPEIIFDFVPENSWFAWKELYTDKYVLEMRVHRNRECYVHYYVADTVDDFANEIFNMVKKYRRTKFMQCFRASEHVSFITVCADRRKFCEFRVHHVNANTQKSIFDKAACLVRKIL